jgi:hypothetical protein
VPLSFPLAKGIKLVVEAKRRGALPKHWPCDLEDAAGQTVLAQAELLLAKM